MIAPRVRAVLPGTLVTRPSRPCLTLSTLKAPSTGGTPVSRIVVPEKRPRPRHGQMELTWHGRPARELRYAATFDPSSGRNQHEAQRS
jgi:hypothetical protein